MTAAVLAALAVGGVLISPGAAAAPTAVQPAAATKQAAAATKQPAAATKQAAAATKQPAAAVEPVLFGTSAASDGELEHYQQVAGRPIVGYRIYRTWGDRLFSGWQLQRRDRGQVPFTSIKSVHDDGSVISWAAIAAATPGSPLHAEMVTRAREAAAYGRPVFLAFNHEPDASGSASMGSPADFVAAWRAMHRIYTEQGADNVRWVLTLTAWSFTSGKAAAWYPGDQYVDAIAGDGYNWYRCRSAAGSWTSFTQVFDGLRRFGLAHPTKPLMIWEFGSVEDPGSPGRKAAWWDDVRRVLRDPAWRQFSVVLTWNGRNNRLANGCTFDFATSGSSQQAWVRMRRDWFLSTWRVR